MFTYVSVGGSSSISEVYGASWVQKAETEGVQVRSHDFKFFSCELSRVLAVLSGLMSD